MPIKIEKTVVAKGAYMATPIGTAEGHDEMRRLADTMIGNNWPPRNLIAVATGVPSKAKGRPTAARRHRHK